MNIAQRVAAHPRWRWEPGMGVTALSEDSRTPVTGIYLTGNDVAVEDDVWAVDVITLRPDIHHPATRGWLLEMLREAHKYESLTPQACKFSNRPPERKWDVEVWDETFTAPTEGEALAAALLDVWGTP